MSPTTFDRLSKGDLILLTGVSGLIGSAIADEALRAGFRVRGVTRDSAKLTGLITNFESQYGKGLFEAVEVADIADSKLFIPHLEGVSAVLHVASDSELAPTPRKTIDATVATNVGLMKEAAKVPSIKAFTVTSSRVASFLSPQPGQSIHVATDTWLDGITEQALSLPTDDPNLPALSYFASKYEGEKACWEYYRAEKPHFAFSTILPDYVIGTPVNPRKGTYSTHSWLLPFYEGNYGPETFFRLFTSPASLFVHLRDVAKAHVISVAASEVKEDRIFAATATFSAAEVADAIRKVEPEWKAPEELEQAMPASNITVPNERFAELIQKFYGRPLANLEETMENWVKEVQTLK